MRPSASYRCHGRLSSRKSFLILVVGSLAVALAGCTNSGASASGGGGGKGGRGRGAGGDVPVTVAKATQKNVPVEIQVIGNVEAYNTISVKAQVTGQLTQVHFKEGDYVKKGDLLFNIDPRPLQAALDQAKANLDRDKATLGQSDANLARDEAQARYAQAQSTRYTQLFQNGIISKDQSEQLRANAEATAQAVAADRATINSTKAAIESSEAAVENAVVQLGYCEIFSPIDGRTGNLTVKQGNVVSANTVELMTINEIEPIYVTFSVPESQLPAIKRYMALATLPVRARPQDDDTGPEENGGLRRVRPARWFLIMCTSSATIRSGRMYSSFCADCTSPSIS